MIYYRQASDLTVMCNFSISINDQQNKKKALRIVALLFGIAFHLQLVLLCYPPIFLRPYLFLKHVSFLGANPNQKRLWGLLMREALYKCSNTIHCTSMSPNRTQK